MTAFAQEPLFPLATEAAALLQQHYAELVPDTDGLPLNIDWERVACLYESGQMVIYTARDDGQLVGYAVFMVYDDFHHKGQKVACCDALYLQPQARRGRAGIDLIRYAERMLKQRGVHRAVWYIHRNRDITRLMQWLGYEAEPEIVVGKNL